MHSFTPLLLPPHTHTKPNYIFGFTTLISKIHTCVEGEKRRSRRRKKNRIIPSAHDQYADRQLHLFSRSVHNSFVLHVKAIQLKQLYFQQTREQWKLRLLCQLSAFDEGVPIGDPLTTEIEIEMTMDFSSLSLCFL